MAFVVFDLDGTLIDSQRDLAEAANALILERGGTPQPVEAIAAMVGEGAALLVRRALTAAGLPADSDGALPRFLELYDERLLQTTQLYDGMADALDRLAHHVLAVLTNKPANATRQILEGLGIAARFRWIVGGDGPFPRKPDPSSLLYLIEQAHTTGAETVMVGDSAIDLATARAAGTRVCVARYGFGFKPHAIDLRGDEPAADRAAEIPAAIERALRATSVHHIESRDAGVGGTDSGTGV